MYKKFWILSILVLLYNPTYAISGRGIEKAVNAIANGASHIAQATHAVKYNNMESVAIWICLLITAAVIFLFANIGAKHYSCTPKQYILRLLSFNGTIGRDNNKTIIGVLAVIIILLLIVIVSITIGGNSSSGVIDDENSSFGGTSTDTDYYNEPADTASMVY